MNFPLREAARKKLEELKNRPQSMTVEVDQASGEIFLDGGLGDDIMARDVRAALKQIGNRKAKIFINSPGGDVVESLAIYAALSEHAPGVDTYNMALAASAASLLLQAGERRYAFPNSMLMIHSPFMSTRGNAEELAKSVEVLQKYETLMVSVYQKRTGKTDAKIREWLSAETWFSSAESLNENFVDAIVGDDDAMMARTKGLAMAKARTSNGGPKYGSLAWARSKAIRSKVAQMKFEKEMAAKYPNNVEQARAKLLKLKVANMRLQRDLEQDLERLYPN